MIHLFWVHFIRFRDAQDRKSAKIMGFSWKYRFLAVFGENGRFWSKCAYLLLNQYYLEAIYRNKNSLEAFKWSKTADWKKWYVPIFEKVAKLRCAILAILG